MSQQINLFNPALKTRRSWLTASTMALAIGGGAACLAGYGYMLNQNVTASEQRAAASAAELKILQDRLLAEAQAVKRQPSNMLADEVARLNAIVNERQQMQSRLQGAGLGSTDGFSPYLVSLARQNARGVWLTGISVTGGTGDIFVRGRALSADLLPGYIRLLNREQALQGKAISELQLTEKNDERLMAGKDGVASAAAKGEAARVSKAPARYIEFSLGSRTAANADG